jgi:hypothetical protein
MTKCPKCGSENIERVEHGASHGAVFYCQADNCSFYWIPSQQSEISILTAQIQEKDSLIVFLRKNLSDRASLQCDNFDAVQVENSTQAKRIKELEEGLRQLQYAIEEDNIKHWCEDKEHDGLNDPIHEMNCLGCGAYKCQPCKPDCWLAKLLEGK